MNPGQIEMLRHLGRLQTIVGMTNPEPVHNIVGASTVEMTRQKWYETNLSQPPIRNQDPHDIVIL